MEMKTRWVSAIGYKPRDASIYLFFAKHIIPFLSELSSNFTQYKLAHILKFKSSHTIRFYELFKASMNSEITLTIEQLKAHLQLEDSYARMDRFQDSVIKPSMAEINEYTDIKASYSLVKEGRKITAFKFIFVCLEDKKSKIKSKPNYSKDRIDGVLKTDLEKYAKPGESYSQAATRIKAEQLILEKNGKTTTIDVIWR